MRFTLLLIPFFLIFATGCNTDKSKISEVIKLTSSNKNNLKKVIEAYKNTDSNKLKAASFLIENMDNHYSIEGHDGYNKVFKSVTNYLKNNKFEKDTITKIWNLAMENNPSVSLIKKKDVNSINADYLIENIEMAFKARERLPESFRCSNDLFLNYVLPYRIESEPLEKGLRKKLHEKYSWAYSVLNETKSLERTICQLYDSLNVQFAGKIRYPADLPISQLEKIKGANCSNLVNLVVHVLRSIGIPCTKDYTPHWGNHLSNGHAWLVIFIRDKAIPVDVIDTRILDSLYAKASIPKVYRKVFYSNRKGGIKGKQKDVTHLYKSKNNIEIDIIVDGRTAPLYVFERNGNWKTVGYSEKGNKKITFTNIGKNIVYATQNPKNPEVFYPFYLDNNSNVQPFIPDYKNTISTAVITRKWQPYKARNPVKLDWIYSVNGCKIMGANKSDFSDAQFIAEVNLSNSRRQIIHSKNQNKYSYYFLKTPESKETPVHLSSFHLLNESGEIIRTNSTVMSNDVELSMTESNTVTDTLPLTFIEKKKLKVIYHFPEQQKINYFAVQSRNDDNNIRPHDEYELMFWDKSWISTGRKVAKTDSLIYSNLPSKTAYWLKNHTRGKEEHIFMIDSNGKQYWPVSVYDKKEHYDKHMIFKQPQLCNIKVKL
ncbi:transglutaminase domain-containing protein [uncultured Maribacter sp.]|uniref:transglutaminase domain-containing protein n=1 Tax=uncultured Maribacter sp. TaxID=431308 RepID=UPI002625E5E6|nr:transglutaminase domain-containing protein [uncultured Maribacter sp.]